MEAELAHKGPAPTEADGHEACSWPPAFLHPASAAFRGGIRLVLLNAVRRNASRRGRGRPADRQATHLLLHLRSQHLHAMNP